MQSRYTPDSRPSSADPDGDLSAFHGSIEAAWERRVGLWERSHSDNEIGESKPIHKIVLLLKEVYR